MCAARASDTGKTVDQYVDKAASKAQIGIIWRHVGLPIEGTERARAVSFSTGEHPVPSIVSRETF